MKNSMLAVSIAVTFAIAGCEQGLTPSAAVPDAPAPAPDVVPVPSGPQQIYRIDKVTPMIASGAQLSWFRNNEGSPREIGGFVGRAVIRGIEGRFSGDLPAELEVNIQQFNPVIVTPTTQDGAVHRVKVDLILRDPITRDEIERSENIFMDLIALSGTASNIARNAGRTPEARLEERIARITSAWANELNCETTRCPIAIAPVVTPAPVPVAEPVPSPEPEPRPAAVAAPTPAPVPVPVVPDAPTPAAIPVAEDSDDDGPGFFGRLFGSDVSDEPEPAPEPVEVIEPAPAPEPVPEPVAEAPIEEEESEESHGFFAALFGDDDDEEEVEDAAPEPVEAPEPAVVEAEPAAPAEAEEAVEAEEGTTIEGFFGNLLGQPEEEPETPVAAVEPAPAPAPVPAAPPAAPVVTPAPAVTPPPAPAAAPTPEPAPAVRIPEVADDEAQSPFFRSPASTPPTLPQTALLGRSQRQNDPLRRQPGDVVLEISNLPAFWDGDVTSGGIWVALPYVPAYRRAVVSNPANGRTVEANLFWRDPQAGGGSTLLSSAAAEALGVAPGQVSNLGVKVVASE